MPLPSSGPLSLSDIQTEFGGSNPIGLNEYYAGGGLVPAGTTGTNGAVPSSGQIAISNFYGTAAVYNLNKSLRFRASASAWLNRTPASSSNLQTWTISWWTKRGQLSTAAQTTMFGTDYAASQEFMLQFTANNRFVFEQYASGGSLPLGNLITTQVFRDPSAWYHFVVTWDSTQATASNRIKIYVNGSQITAFDTASYPSQNASSVWNQATNQHRIGQYSTAKFYDGYMGEVIFVDGQALTPSSFGQTSTSTGVWIPKSYSGSYGTNGFYLPFTNTTSTTTLVADSSGNGNNWTPNNISLTAGITYDSMTDVPTNTSATVANYSVMNPLRPSSYGAAILTNGNLNVAQNTTSYVASTSTFAVSSGKWYWEVTCGVAGFVTSNGITTNVAANGFTTGMATYHYDGTKYIGASNSAYGASYTNGDILGFALDMDAGTLVCYKNNVSQGTLISGLTGSYYAYTTVYGSNNVNYNFGQRPFSYTPPSGFVALNTFNLTTPTIGASSSTLANKYMNIVLYTGDGVQDKTISGVGFQPDFVWIKNRGAVGSHVLFNAITGGTKQLFSNLTDAEQTNNDITNGFSSDGFIVGDNVTGTGSTNQNTNTYVAWNWNGGGSTVTNTSGSISAQVRANTTAGFSIVTYTGNATSGATVGHGLGVAPSFIICKSRTQGAIDWPTYHISTGNNGGCTLNETAAKSTTSTWWNNTTPSSTVVTLGSGAQTNGNTQSMLLYCFAQVAGYSAFGSYTGNGSTDGPFIYTGFRPRFILTKATSFSTASTVWTIWDTARSPYNAAVLELYPNSSSSESTDSAGIDILSNGFKPRRNSEYANSNGQTYIYIAIAESPFKYANAR